MTLARLLHPLLSRWTAPGALSCNGWEVWDQDSQGIVGWDTWVEGFSPGECAAMQGHACVRVYYWPNEKTFSFTVYEDDEEADILEPVTIPVGKGSHTDLEPPSWLKRRIRRMLPPIPKEEDE